MTDAPGMVGASMKERTRSGRLKREGAMSRDFWMILSSAVVTTLFVSAASFSAWKASIPGLLQRENMRLANEGLAKVQAVVDADPRLAEVRLGVYTGMNGAVWLFGSVEDSEELLDLMRAVGELRLSVPIYWSIKVWSELEAELAMEKKVGYLLDPHGN